MDPTSHSHFDLHLILVGADVWLAQRKTGDFNVPDITTWALHALHQRQIERSDMPTVTHEETLRYLTRPLDELFDPPSIPSSLTAVSILDNFPIETEFDLADGIIEYLQQKGLDRVSTVGQLIEKDTNAAARSKQVELSNQYQSAELSDTQRRNIEQQYVDWRTFFTVEHNIVNPQADGLVFDAQWLAIRDEFYEPAHRRRQRIVDHNADGDPVYRISPTCGLLYRNNSDEFQPITSVPAFDPHIDIEERPIREGDFVLKQTHQRRILIPGIPEMVLYEALLNHPAVTEVRLYPGVDRYDLRVRLRNNMIHGIDVKDYRRPQSMEKLLRRQKAHPNIDEHEQNELGYDYFFYLLPEARVALYDHGLESLRRFAERHQHLEVMTIEGYLQELSHV